MAFTHGVNIQQKCSEYRHGHSWSKTLNNKIDHFTVGAANLTQGIEAMKKMLGVTLSPGSKHDLMSTHNCVMRAGDECFFELIAIDPDVPAPARTRWFSLDDPQTQARLAERPRALCWVVNTDDLDAVVAASPVPLGEIVTFTRGDRSWRLTVPEDGHLPEGGLLPAFIEWSPGPHPSTAQPDLDCRLTSIQLTHPEPERLKETLSALQVLDLVELSAGPKGLSFEIQTLDGIVILD